MLALTLTEASQSLALEASAAPLIFIVMLAMGRLLKRQFGVRFNAVFKLFALSLALYLPCRFSRAPFPWREELAMHLAATTLLTGTICFLAVLRRFFWEGWFPKAQRVPAPKFLSELISLFIFLVALLSAFGGIYGQPIQGAIFGSTIVIGIVGFAMQDLLGNIIAGIALELGKPFRVGDWLLVEGKHVEVTEVNWRSTRLRTSDDVALDIPNKTIVGSTITNLSFPTPVHALRVQIGIEYATPPNLVKDVLVRAVAEVPLVLRKPAPKAYIKDFGDSAVIYEIKFWIQEDAHYNEIFDGVRTALWYAAQRASLHIPFPIRNIQVDRPAAKHRESITTAQQSALKHPFLQLLDETQMSKLLMQARLQRFGRGEKVIEQGTQGQSMFILLHGEADVLVRSNGSEAHVANLAAGDYCGEMSLLTGEPRSATVIARTDCEMWEIDKNTMSELLHANETLVQRLSQMLATRRMATEGVVASNANKSEVLHKQQEYTDSFLRKLCSFFDL